MTVLADIANDVNNYLRDNVTLNIEGLVVQAPGIGPSVTVNERWAFQVRVFNNGQLNMTGVILHILGRNDTQVSTQAAGPFEDSIHFGNLTVNAHGSQDTVNLYFEAPGAVKPADTPLVVVHISTYNTNWQHLMDDHTDHADPPAATYSNQVFPA